MRYSQLKLLNHGFGFTQMTHSALGILPTTQSIRMDKKFLWNSGAKYKIPAPKRKRDKGEDLNARDHKFTYDSANFEVLDWHRINQTFCFYPFVGILFAIVGYNLVDALIYGNNKVDGDENAKYWDTQQANMNSPYMHRESLLSRMNDPIDAKERGF